MAFYSGRPLDRLQVPEGDRSAVVPQRTAGEQNVLGKLDNLLNLVSEQKEILHKTVKNYGELKETVSQLQASVGSMQQKLENQQKRTKTKLPPELSVRPLMVVWYFYTYFLW